MEYRTLEIKVISGRDLKKVNLIMKEETYVVVSLSGDPNNKQRSEIDRDGDANPNWNFPAKFTVSESDIQQDRLSLEFRIRCDRNLGDKDIGEVIVPVKDLAGSIDDGKLQFVTYQIRKPSGKPKGQLHFSYQWSAKSSGLAPTAAPSVSEAPKIDGAVTAYPAVGPSSVTYPAIEPTYMAGTGSYPQPGGYPPPYPPAPVSGYQYPQAPGSGHQYPPHGYGSYPPPPPGYGGHGGGYPPPPPPGYGYGAQPGYGYGAQPGYGYPPVQQPVKKNKSGLGMGLGAGLLGGALGGLLIGDMVSDGFGDGGF